MERIVLEFTRTERAGEAHAFRFAPQTYLMRTPGGGFNSAEFPWTRALLDDLRAVRDPSREPEVAHRLGEALRGFLVGVGWDAIEQGIVRAVRAGEPVHITVRSAAAELYALPWELLALRSTGQLLGSIPGLLVRYEWPDTASFPDRIATTARRGRVLCAWSAAGGAVPAADHLAALRDALGPAFDARQDVLAHATYAAIADALARAQRDGPPIDALHLLCHGAQAGGGYALAFDGEEAGGGPVLVDAGRLQQLLAPHAGMLRLVVLAACDSGNVGEPGSLLGSVAQMVHRAGVRALLASRFPLSVAGSCRLSAALYPALARGETLELAVVGAREALARDPSQLDWASLQLYSREADGEATHVLGVGPAPAIVAPARRRRWPLLLASVAGLAGVAGLAAIVVAQQGGTVTAPVAAPDGEPEPATATSEGEPGASEAATSGEPVQHVDAAGSPRAGSQTTTVEPGEAVAPEPTTPVTTKPPPRPQIAKAPTRPSACSASVKLYLESRLPVTGAPSGKVELEVQVDASGELDVRARSGDASQLAAARSHLGRSDASRLVRLGADGLPCKSSLVWLP